MLATDSGDSVGDHVSVGTDDGIEEGINDGILDGNIEFEPFGIPWGSFVLFFSLDWRLGLGETEGESAIDGERLGIADGETVDDAIIGRRCRRAVPQGTAPARMITTAVWNIENTMELSSLLLFLP